MIWVTSISHSGRQRTVGIIIGPKAARRVVKSTETYYISMLFRMRLSRFCHLLIPTETKKNNSTLRTRHFHRISFLILITLLHFSTATYHREAQELAETKKHSTLHVPHCPTVYRHWKFASFSRNILDYHGLMGDVPLPYALNFCVLGVRPGLFWWVISWDMGPHWFWPHTNSLSFIKWNCAPFWSFILPGWWFGTFLNIFDFSKYWESSSQLTNIFRGVETTNQSPSEESGSPAEIIELVAGNPRTTKHHVLFSGNSAIKWGGSQNGESPSNMI